MVGRYSVSNRSQTPGTPGTLEVVGAGLLGCLMIVGLIVLIFAAYAAILGIQGAILYWAWNLVVPSLSHNYFPEITYWQAVALCFIVSLVVGKRTVHVTNNRDS